jgi:hypothetical protein
MLISKLTRDNFINFLENICNNIPISNKLLGLIIRLVHFNLTMVILIFVLFAPEFLALLCIIFTFIMIIMYILLGGCILTILEQRLCKENYTIIDPFIKLIGLEINSKNRKLFTLCTMLPFLPIILLIFYFRFIYINNQ